MIWSGQSGKYVMPTYRIISLIISFIFSSLLTISGIPTFKIFNIFFFYFQVSMRYIAAPH